MNNNAKVILIKKFLFFIDKDFDPIISFNYNYNI